MSSMLGGDKGGVAGNVYGDLLADTLSQQLSAGPGLGLGRFIERQLTPHEGKSHASVESAGQPAPATNAANAKPLNL
jgi:Rod binding domain-containing protein